MMPAYGGLLPVLAGSPPFTVPSWDCPNPDSDGVSQGKHPAYGVRRLGTATLGRESLLRAQVGGYDHCGAITHSREPVAEYHPPCSILSSGETLAASALAPN